MWICKKCNEEIEDNFDSCWNCTKESDVPIDESSKKPDLNTLIDNEIKTIEELKIFLKEKHPDKPKVRGSFTTGGFKIKKRFLSVFGNPVIGVELWNPDEVVRGGYPSLNRYVPNEILQSIPFCQMLLLAIFYFPSHRFEKNIEKFIVTEWSKEIKRMEHEKK